MASKISKKSKLKITEVIENNERTLGVIQLEIDNKCDKGEIDPEYYALCKEYNVLCGKKMFFETSDEKFTSEESDTDDEKIVLKDVTCNCNIILVKEIKTEIEDMSEETYKELVEFCESKGIKTPTSPVLLKIWRDDIKEAQNTQNFTDEIFVMARNYNIAVGHKIYAENIDEATAKNVIATSKKKDVKAIVATAPGEEIKRNRKGFDDKILICVLTNQYYIKHFKYDKSVIRYRYEIKNLDGTISYPWRFFANKGEENEMIEYIKSKIANDAKAIGTTKWLYEPPAVDTDETIATPVENQMQLDFA